MRLRLNRGRTPPRRVAGFGLIVVGALILLLALPLHVYVAVVGIVIAYIGNTLRSR